MRTTRNRAGAATDVVLLAGAVSAGVHAALAPEHVREWLPLGAAFIVAASAVAVALVAFTLRPGSPWPARLLAGLLGGLVAAYGLTRLAALPPLDPDREPLDALGVCTCAVEAVGVLSATHLGWRRRRSRQSIALTTGGTA
jgi:hypothetical protein